MKKVTRILSALICAALLLSLMAVPAMAEGYKIGVIQLVEHDALDAATRGFVNKLTELLGEGNVEIDVQVAQGEVANCATLATKFVNDEVDLIMANATPALTAAAAATGDIPVLGTSVTDFVSAGVLRDEAIPGVNISGTSDLVSIDAQIEMMLTLCPEAKTVGILYCSSEPNSVFQADLAEAALKAANVAVNRYTVADSSEIQTVLTMAMGEIDALYIPTDNLLADNMGIVQNLTVPEKLPVVTGEENMCRNGGLATVSISYEKLGEITAEMAYEILVNGASIEEMAVRHMEMDQYTYGYNPVIAEELGITVPENMTAINMGE